MGRDRASETFTLDYFDGIKSANWSFPPFIVTVFLKNIGEFVEDIKESNLPLDEYSELIAEMISYYIFVEFLCFDSLIDEYNESRDTDTNLDSHRQKYYCQKEGNPEFCFFQELSFFIFNHFTENIKFDDKLEEFIPKIKAKGGNVT